MSTGYTFGDDERAAHRLRLLAQLFGPGSRELLTEVRAGLVARPRRALDLGCGPGLTTRLLADVTGAHETVGLDASERYVAQATATFPDLAFRCRDVRRGPLADGPGDVVYARFLLTHLPDVPAVLRAWAAELAPAGVLVLEELHTMTGSHPVLEDYYAVLDAMQAANGQVMHIGRDLPRIAREAGLVAIIDRVTRRRHPGDRMAALHHLNIGAWSTNDWVQRTIPAAEVARIADGLADLATRPDASVHVDYQMQQLALVAS